MASLARGRNPGCRPGRKPTFFAVFRSRIGFTRRTAYDVDRLIAAGVIDHQYLPLHILLLLNRLQTVTDGRRRIVRDDDDTDIHGLPSDR